MKVQRSTARGGALVTWGALLSGLLAVTTSCIFRTGPAGPIRLADRPLSKWSPVPDAGGPPAGAMDLRSVIVGDYVIVLYHVCDRPLHDERVDAVLPGGRQRSAHGSCRATAVRARRFDLRSRAWRPVSAHGMPTDVPIREFEGTGRDRVVVFGDRLVLLEESRATAYDPEANRWSPLPPIPPRTRVRRVAFGRDYLALFTQPEQGGYGKAFEGGALLLTSSKAWISIPEEGAPSPWGDAQWFWTGTELLVWFDSKGEGARWRPGDPHWRPIRTQDAPAPRERASLVWTGTELLVWGGSSKGSDLRNGARYDPASDGWRPMATEAAPSSTWDVQTYWSGQRVLFWKECASDSTIYDPASNRWERVTIPKFEWAFRAAGASRLRDAGEGRVAVLVETGVAGLLDVDRNRWFSLDGASLGMLRDLSTRTWTGRELFAWGGHRVVREVRCFGPSPAPNYAVCDPAVENEPVASGGIWTPVAAGPDEPDPLAAPFSNQSNVEIARFTPDGKTIVAAATQRLIGWDAMTGRTVWKRHVSGGFGSVRRMSFMRSVPVAIVGGDDGRVLAIRTDDGRPVREYGRVPRAVTDIALSPDEDLVVAVGIEGHVAAWHAATGATAKLEVPAFARLFCAAWSPDGRHLALGGDRLAVVEVETGRSRVVDVGGAVLALAFLPGGEHIVVGVSRNTAVVERRRASDLALDWRTRETPTVTRLLAVENGQGILSIGSDGVRRLDRRTGSSAPVLAFSPERPLASIDLSPDGHRALLYAPSASTVTVRDWPK